MIIKSRFSKLTACAFTAAVTLTLVAYPLASALAATKLINPLMPPSLLNSQPDKSIYNPLLPKDDLLNQRPKTVRSNSVEERPKAMRTPDWETPGQTPGMYVPPKRRPF